MTWMSHICMCVYVLCHVCVCITSFLQNIVSFIGLFCKRDLLFHRCHEWVICVCVMSCVCIYRIFCVYVLIHTHISQRCQRQVTSQIHSSWLIYVVRDSLMMRTNKSHHKYIRDEYTPASWYIRSSWLIYVVRDSWCAETRDITNASKKSIQMSDVKHAYSSIRKYFAVAVSEILKAHFTIRDVAKVSFHVTNTSNKSIHLSDVVIVSYNAGMCVYIPYLVCVCINTISQRCHKRVTSQIRSLWLIYVVRDSYTIRQRCQRQVTSHIHQRRVYTYVMAYT